ncbi:CS1-pili formation C-terminal domain-containing protein [Enterobacter kobei]|uniref:CS1-pili formation C-terminal domain-containing protein n=1 Tax=Enterobacter kobei TaxID=208224 RepID=UPI002A81A601|nr:CS1-pili formation C-terminal domain-containing protein [Enterobacter kobei]
MTLFSKKTLTIAVMMSLMSLPVTAFAMEDLNTQAENLPADFSSHFFDAPLLTKVELDGEYLGDAMVLLSRNNTVQLINFSQFSESKLSSQVRNRWANTLKQSNKLGKCDKNCADGLISLDYSLINAALYITTDADKNARGGVRHIALPETGSSGLILRNQMNLVGGEMQPWSGYQSLQAQGSIGNWTAQASSQLSRSDVENSHTEARVSSLFLQRELPGKSVRAGLFMPDSQGILRQPQMPGSQSSQTLVGVMVGSSDTLLETSGQASVYPLYVTANRDAIAEIYRDGVLINSQPVKPGMQQLDTTVLPSGIYSVEVRILELGKEISRSEETIYKPNSWRNPESRWQYNIYGGVEQQLGNNRLNDNSGKEALGASANYLLHPRVIVGAAGQRNANGNQVGASTDIQAGQNVRLYGSVGVSDSLGSRFDTQFNWQMRPQTSLMLNHSQSWYGEENSFCGNKKCQTTKHQSSGATLNHRLDNGDSLSLRGTHYEREKSVGIDANWRTRFTVKDTPISLTLNAFDRPYRQSGSTRNRGANLNLSFALGGSGRSINATLGSRNDNRGEREMFASAGISQSFEQGSIKSFSAGVTGDRYGLSGNIYSDFAHRYASGSIYAQSTSNNSKLSGGINMSNTLAVGGGKVSASHTPESWASHTGMIIDVESDDADVILKAWDSMGTTSILRAGRNFIPVNAWKSGQMQIDFIGKDAPALKVWPTELPYHLNKGGVATAKVRVMKTVTVIGRVVDINGNPLSGAKLVNHAGHGISEGDGFFVTDMHEHTPELIIHSRNDQQCKVHLDVNAFKRENNTLMVGDLSCKKQKS